MPPSRQVFPRLPAPLHPLHTCQSPPPRSHRPLLTFSALLCIRTPLVRVWDHDCHSPALFEPLPPVCPIPVMMSRGGQGAMYELPSPPCRPCAKSMCPQFSSAARFGNRYDVDPRRRPPPKVFPHHGGRRMYTQCSCLSLSLPCPCHVPTFLMLRMYVLSYTDTILRCTLCCNVQIKSQRYKR
jgi:hypothetical protein